MTTQYNHGSVIVTFHGPDASTWDADEVEAWYAVAQQIHDAGCGLWLDDPATCGAQVASARERKEQS
jgi:hypothetical protein